MTALILETSQTEALLGISQGRVVLCFTALVADKSLSKELHRSLERLLGQTKLAAIDYLAIGIGPGSYVGSRTAVTIGKTLSFALEKPVVTFPSPIAFLPEDYTGPFTFLADAKMGQLALFDGQIEESGRAAISPFRLVDKKSFSPPLKRLLVQAEKLNPKIVAEYVYEKFERGEVCSADELTPLYYR